MKLTIDNIRRIALTCSIAAAIRISNKPFRLKFLPENAGIPMPVITQKKLIGQQIRQLISHQFAL